jgi:hypothetical protein
VASDQATPASQWTARRAKPGYGAARAQTWQNRRVSNDRPSDLVAGVLNALAIFAGVLELFYRPFRVGPVALLLVLIALVMSSKHPRLSATAAGFVGFGFLIGASIAVWDSHALY